MKRLSPNVLSLVALVIASALAAVSIAEELASKDASGRSIRLIVYAVLPIVIALAVRAGALNRARVSPVQKLGFDTMKKTGAKGVVVADSEKGPVVLATVGTVKEYLALLEKGKLPTVHTLVVAQKVQADWQREIAAAVKGK